VRFTVRQKPTLRGFGLSPLSETTWPIKVKFCTISFGCLANIWCKFHKIKRICWIDTEWLIKQQTVASVSVQASCSLHPIKKSKDINSCSLFVTLFCTTFSRRFCYLCKYSTAQFEYISDVCELCILCLCRSFCLWMHYVQVYKNLYTEFQVGAWCLLKGLIWKLGLLGHQIEDTAK